MKKQKTPNTQSNKDGKSTLKKVWWIAWIILLLILITFIIILIRTSSFATPEKNSIFLVPANPGLEVNDGKQAWGVESCIDLFESTYSGNGKDISVESSNGDKVIAPGTESEYTFNLKNTGNVAMDYSVTIDASLEINLDEVGLKELPIGVRLRTYSGEYLLGDGKTWASVSNLENYVAQGTLSVNNYAWYTLEWKWLYEEYVIDENGNTVGPVGDEWDTILGNMSSDTPVSLNVTISTTATPSTSFSALGGIEQDFTDADDAIERSQMGGVLRLWPLILIVILLILMTVVAVMIFRSRAKDEDEDEAEAEAEDSLE